MSSASWPDDEGGAPPPRDEGPPSRRVPRGRVGKVAFVVAAVLLLLSLAASLWTESLWFSSLGYSDMWWTRLRTQVLLFVVGGLVTALPIGLSLWPVSYTHLTLPTTSRRCRSRWSPAH